MSKKYKMLIGLVVAILFIVLIVIAISQSGKQAATPQGQNSLPSYTLLPAEENTLREVVKNFVSLYNTYSSYDVSNLQSLGDLETPEMQQKTVEYMNSIQDSMPKGYSVRTEALDQTFSYIYPSADELHVTIRGQAKEIKPAADPHQIPEVSNFGVTFQLMLKKQNDAWLVDAITLQKD